MRIALVLIALAVLCTSSVQAEVNTSRYWNMQGDDLHNQYKYEDALDAYDKAIEINDSNVPALTGKGSVLCHLNRYNESLQACEDALAINPLYIRAWMRKGIVLEAMGRYNESLQSYDRAIEIDPEYANAWNSRSWLFYGLGRYVEAIDDADKAIGILECDLMATLDTKGVALAGLGRYEEALEYIERAIVLDPTVADVWFHKGDVLKAVGRDDDAEAAYATARALPLMYPIGEAL